MNEEKAIDKIMGIISDKKRCPVCGIEKPVDAFYKDKYKKDGFKTKCKDCCAEYDRKFNRKDIDKKECLKITLDFSKISFGKELLDKVKNDAEINLRTIENEIFFTLKDVM